MITFINNMAMSMKKKNFMLLQDGAVPALSRLTHALKMFMQSLFLLHLNTERVMICLLRQIW